jgi:hypothetical protein
MASYNYVPVSHTIGLQPIETTDTTQRHPLGTIVRAADPTYGEAEFIYLKGVLGTAAGHWVIYEPDDWSTTRTLGNARGAVAIAMSANAASQYGWYMIHGKHPAAKCKTGFADGGYVFLTSTTGGVDDASVAGDLVYGARGASTTTVNSFVAEFEIARPWVMDRNVPTGP